MQKSKASILATGWLDEQDARAIESGFTAQVIGSQDAREGLRAFAEKRRPRFGGR